MKSIDKLRKVAEEQSSPVMCKLVRAYTGKDAMSVSNAEVMEALGIAVDEIEEELATYYVELPKDSDGIPIRPDDEIVVSHPNMEPRHSTVTALILTDRWDFEEDYEAYETDSRDVNDLSDFYENVKHVQPDSWEKIIEDVRRRTSDYYCNNIPCNFDKMAEEMVARCKALAGAE